MPITMYGTYWCTDCKRAKQFFGENRVSYEFVDIDANPDGLAYVERVNNGKQVIPVIEFDDESTLVEPSNAQLAEKIGLRTKGCPRVSRTDDRRQWPRRFDRCPVRRPRGYQHAW